MCLLSCVAGGKLLTAERFFDPICEQLELRRINMNKLHHIFISVTVLLHMLGCGSETNPTIASVVGQVVRTAPASANLASTGTLYVSLFKSDPIRGGADSDTPVAVMKIEDVNLSTPGEMLSFELSDVPVREEAYFLTAVYDANQNLDQMTPPGPDDGDVVALNGVQSPSIVVDRASVEALIELNFECSGGICSVPSN